MNLELNLKRSIEPAYPAAKKARTESTKQNEK